MFFFISMKKVYLLFCWCFFLYGSAIAEIYEDANYGIVYQYSIGSGEAEVYRSPNCLGSIRILESFTSTDSLVNEDYSKKEVTCTYVVNKIRNSALQNCEELQDVIIPNSIKEIGEGAFYEDAKLESIVIPNSVQHIGGWAFSKTRLKNIVIGDAVNYIGEYAFATQVSLQDVYALRQNPQEYNCATNAFNSQEMHRSTLHVPVGCKKLYENSSPWCYFKQIVEDEDITSVNDIQKTERRNNAVYDIQGFRVKQGRKGQILVIQGKKVML